MSTPGPATRTQTLSPTQAPSVVRPIRVDICHKSRCLTDPGGSSLTPRSSLLLLPPQTFSSGPEGLDFEPFYACKFVFSSPSVSARSRTAPSWGVHPRTVPHTRGPARRGDVEGVTPSEKKTVQEKEDVQEQGWGERHRGQQESSQVPGPSTRRQSLPVSHLDSPKTPPAGPCVQCAREVSCVRGCHWETRLPWPRKENHRLLIFIATKRRLSFTLSTFYE